MININLTTEEARNIGSWAKIIIKNLQERIDGMPVLKKKAEIVLMEHQQQIKNKERTFIDFLSSFIESALPAREAEQFIKNYDKEIEKMNFDFNCWMLIEEQIKNQIINETTPNKNSKDGQSNPSSESGEEHY